jgi:hypothetical protein
MVVFLVLYTATCVTLSYYNKDAVLTTQDGSPRVLVTTSMIALTQRVGASAIAAQVAIHPPRATLHAINTGGAKGSATPNVNPAAE